MIIRQWVYNGYMKFVELSEAEFEQAKLPGRSFLQSVEMWRRYQKLGREAYLVGVKDAGRVVAAGLMLGRNWRFGKKIFRVPGGWLMDYKAEHYQAILKCLTVGVQDFAGRRGGIAVQISPNLVSQTRDTDNRVVAGEDNREVKRELESLDYKYLGEFEQPKWIYVKDLGEQQPDEMLMDFRTTHRQLIKKAEREGVRVRDLGIDELGTLKQITDEAAERHGFEDPDLDYYHSMKAAFGDKVMFVVAEISRENLKSQDQEKYGTEGDYVPLAASMFVKDEREVVYLYSGSRRELQKYNGSYAIQWLMINTALELGLTRYNFYGVKPVAGNGVYKFKQGFRGQVEELLGTFVLPIGVLGRLYAARLRPQEYGEMK